MKKFKIILMLMGVLCVTGCSSTDLLKSAVGLDQKGIDAEVVVGQKQQVANTQLGDRANTIVNNDKIPFSFMVLMALGWLLPSPNEIWRGTVKLFKD